MQILNIAGYKFTELSELTTLKASLLEACLRLNLKGTILLSSEGINLTLAGLPEDIAALKAILESDIRLQGMRFHHTYSAERPFKRMKVKLKKEIVTLRKGDETSPASGQRAPALSPKDLKQWLDENRDITLLDTRNDYEYDIGTFQGAINLHLKNFCELPEKIQGLDKHKPVVMVCTGGIRCEKASLYMQQQGFDEVYQLDGGILGYFAEVGGAHYRGRCFVFDDRVSVDSDLR